MQHFAASYAPEAEEAVAAAQNDHVDVPDFEQGPEKAAEAQRVELVA